ncbi:hypothetical protein [Pseudogracilibacillus sp. SO30301A]|uniref:hypothetical protein n=1 Tax=Pseudogracilibacillus sp. SO30301A TaxID=3098291 RepID=UPI00300E44F3
MSENNNIMTEDVVKRNYLQASDYEVNDFSIRLVFQIDDHHKENLASDQTLNIQYKTFGIRKEQQIKVERSS